jgi:hypothetical protein
LLLVFLLDLVALCLAIKFLNVRVVFAIVVLNRHAALRCLALFILHALFLPLQPRTIYRTIEDEV